MISTRDWLINWFIINGDANEEELRQNLDVNYFEKGYIDSFKFISMIAEIEEEFNVEFDNDQFEDRSFSTINGLTRVIEEIKNNAES